MLCSEFDARLQRLLDLRQAPDQDAALLHHTHDCAECRLQLDTMTRLLDSGGHAEPPPLPADFAQRVVLAVVNDPAYHPRRSRQHVLMVLAMAAALLLAVLPMAWRLRRPADAPPTLASPTGAGTAQEAASAWLVPTLFGLYPEETRQRHRQQVNQIAHDLSPIATPFSAALTAIRQSLPVTDQTPREPSASLGPTHSATTLRIVTSA